MARMIAAPIHIWVRTILTEVGIDLVGEAQLIAADCAAR
jgi:hypothetical protein